MKKFFIAVSSVAVLTLLAAGLSIAEPTNNNELGLYMTQDGYGETGTFDLGLPVVVYLVLTKPAQESGAPATGVNAFDCQLNFNPAGGIFKLGDTLPPGSINIGDADSIALGYLEYIVGIGAPWPVVDEAVTLITFTFLNTNAAVIDVTLGPVGSPSIPGEMALLTSDDPALVVMYPVSGSPDMPVFQFNGMAVAVEKETFGSVKALYR